MVKNIQIEEELHTLVKIHAAILGESIKEYTERALRLQLADSPIINGDHLPPMQDPMLDTKEMVR